MTTEVVAADKFRFTPLGKAFSRLTTQDVDEWSDVEQVHRAVFIGVRFSLINATGDAIDKWSNVKQVHDPVEIDVAQQYTHRRTDFKQCDRLAFERDFSLSVVDWNVWKLTDMEAILGSINKSLSCRVGQTLKRPAE